MGSVERLIVQVKPSGDRDDEEITELARLLRAYLLDLDVDSVGSVADAAQAEGAKGAGALAGWLAVLPGIAGLRSVVAAVVSWVGRTGHNVEITCGGETLKVSAATSAQQERIINDFLARHAPHT